MQEDSTPTYEFEIVETQGSELVTVDISGASIVIARIYNPNRESTDYTLSGGDISFLTDGTDGIVRKKFTTAEALPGTYEVQCYVNWNGISEFWTNRREFYLNANLPAPS